MGRPPHTLVQHRIPTHPGHPNRQECLRQVPLSFWFLPVYRRMLRVGPFTRPILATFTHVSTKLLGVQQFLPHPHFSSQVELEKVDEVLTEEESVCLQFFHPRPPPTSFDTRQENCCPSRPKGGHGWSSHWTRPIAGSILHAATAVRRSSTSQQRTDTGEVHAE